MDWVHEVVHKPGPQAHRVVHGPGPRGWSMDLGPCFVYVRVGLTLLADFFYYTPLTACSLPTESLVAIALSDSYTVSLSNLLHSSIIQSVSDICRLQTMIAF